MYMISGGVKRGFTLVETMLVVVVTGILLGITLRLGWDYLLTIQRRQDKELMFSTMTDLMTIAKTSSSYTFDYDYMDLALSGGGLTGMIAAGDPESAPFGSGTVIDRYQMTKSTLVFPSDPLRIRVEPYELGCSIVQGLSGFTVRSDVSDDESCYYLDATVCKINQTICP